jgi:hypothetical protein
VEGTWWECVQCKAKYYSGNVESKAEHWRGGAPAAGEPATWRYILRCAQLLATLSTNGISRSVPPLPLTPKRVSASFAAVSVLAGPASHALPVASKRPPAPAPGHHADAHPDLFGRGLPVLSDGLRVCLRRSAVSTAEVAENPSRLSPPHAPTHMHVSLRTTLPPAPARVRERLQGPNTRASACRI